MPPLTWKDILMSSKVGRHNAADTGTTTNDGGSKCGNDHEGEQYYVVVSDDYTTTLQNAGSDQGAATVLVNGFRGAVAGTQSTGSLGDTDCSLGDDGDGATAAGHTPSWATEGSATVFFEDRPVHRVGDKGTNPGEGTYILSDGSPNVLAG